jgi:hypothetical protein
VRKRSELKTAIEGEEHWTKRSKETQFMDQNGFAGEPPQIAEAATAK